MVYARFGCIEGCCQFCDHMGEEGLLTGSDSVGEEDLRTPHHISRRQLGGGAQTNEGRYSKVQTNDTIRKLSYRMWRIACPQPTHCSLRREEGVAQINEGEYNEVRSNDPIMNPHFKCEGSINLAPLHCFSS